MDETAADLAVICSVISSLKNRVLARNTVFIGEAGLSGEVRAVTNVKQRVAEAARLGFAKAVIPYACMKAAEEEKGIKIIPVKSVMDVLKEDIYE